MADLLEPLGKPALAIERSIDANLKPASALLPDTKLEIRSRNKEHRSGTSLNVAGLWEGSDPALKAETVMLTAHYDHLGIQNGHLYPGANDNASGTVAVMELARLFAESGIHPKRSVLFVVFGSEEQLMMGSFYYTSHPLRPLATTRAVLNLDMIGRNEAHIQQDEGGLQIPADTSNLINLVGSFYSPDLRSDLFAANKSVGLVLDTKYDADHTLNALFRCDHLPFLIAHVPAVWLFAGFHPGYHEPSDTMDLLNYDKIAKVISLAYDTASMVADTSSPPQFDVRGK
jgi:Zn-dependent M28 family amino/carboxypeptidase